MNRGFKVFDKQENRMILNPADEGIFLSGNGNLVLYNDFTKYLMDRYIRLDETGFCDKNGQSIFECDILKAKFQYFLWYTSKAPIHKPEYDEIRFFIVQFDNYRWMLNSLEWKTINYSLNEVREYSFGIGIQDIWEDGAEMNRLTDFEYIGNFYENPELEE